MESCASLWYRTMLPFSLARVYIQRLVGCLTTNGPSSRILLLPCQGAMKASLFFILVAAITGPFRVLAAVLHGRLSTDLVGYGADGG